MKKKIPKKISQTIPQAFSNLKICANSAKKIRILPFRNGKLFTFLLYIVKFNLIVISLNNSRLYFASMFIKSNFKHLIANNMNKVKKLIKP